MKKTKSINKDFNLKRFAADILATREKKDMTMRVFSEWTGLGIATLFRAESGRNVDIKTLVILCNYMGVQVQTYFQ